MVVLVVLINNIVQYNFCSLCVSVGLTNNIPNIFSILANLKICCMLVPEIALSPCPI